MVSQLRQSAVPVSHHGSSSFSSCSLASCAGTLAAVLLLLAACAPLVSANSCTNPQIDGIATSPAVINAGDEVTLWASVGSCTDCTYRWTIYPSSCMERTQTLEGTTIVFPFRYAGDYTVELVVTEQSQPECAPTYGTTPYRTTLSVVGTAHGADGACCDPAGFEISQSTSSSTVGEYTDPYFLIVPLDSPVCYDCEYTWSVYKLSGDWYQPVSMEGSKLPFPTLMSYHFTEPGDYKINLRADNPAVCKVDAIGQYYGTTTVNHHVSAPDSLGQQSGSPAVISPGTADVVTTVPTVAPVTTAAITARPTTIAPQVTNTVIPAATQPVVTIPQGTHQPTMQPAGTPAPILTNAANQLPGQAPVVTTEAPASGIPATTAPVSPVSPAPTRTPGFTFSVALIAAMLVLVLRRK